MYFTLRYSTDIPMAIDINQTKLSIEILKSIGLIKNEFNMEKLWNDNSVIQFKK